MATENRAGSKTKQYGYINKSNTKKIFVSYTNKMMDRGIYGGRVPRDRRAGAAPCTAPRAVGPTGFS